MSTVISAFLIPAYHAITGLAAILVPLLGGLAPAAAVIVGTALVRLALHPLNRAQVRAQLRTEQARAALAPAVAKLTRRHRGDPARLQREIFELYRANGVSLSAGLLPALAQFPVLFVVYRLFVSPRIGDQANALLADRLFGVPLGSHLRDALSGPAASAAHLAVFAALLAAIAAVASWSFVRGKTAVVQTPDPARRGPAAPAPGSSPAMGRLLRLLPYGTVLTAAFVPLATGLYLVTTTLWTVVERRALTRPRRASAASG
jgi:YidC/Oxa1 family membrane protein insertase